MLGSENADWPLLMQMAALFAVSLFVTVVGARMLRNADVYEFYHRTDGGVVEFDDYNAFQRHKRRKWYGGCLATIGLPFALLFLLMMVTGFLVNIGVIGS